MINCPRRPGLGFTVTYMYCHLTTTLSGITTRYLDLNFVRGSHLVAEEHSYTLLSSGLHWQLLPAPTVVLQKVSDVKIAIQRVKQYHRV